ncbi:zinc finger, C2H2 type [Trichuris suis]|nr:zinc finger, C2H2 type [Trichuris suis]
MSHRYYSQPVRQQQPHVRSQSFAMNSRGSTVTSVFSSPQPQPLIAFDQDVTPRYGDTSYGQSSYSTDYNSSFGSDGFLPTPVRAEESYNYESSPSYGRGMLGYLPGMNINGSYSRTTLVSTPQLPSVDFCQRETYRPTLSPFGSANQEHSYPGRGSSMFRTSYGRPLASSGYDTAFKGSPGTFSRSPRASHVRGRKSLSSSRGAAQARTRNTLYCELCKVSCVGQQAYDEHVKGQRHAKRETQAKVVSAAADGKGNNKTLHHCKICNIFCTGMETLKAHQRGVKHQRAMKLQETMGKKTTNGKDVATTEEAEPAKMDTEEPAKGEEQGDAKVSAEVVAGEKQEDQTVMDTSSPLEKEAEVVGEEYLTLIPATKNKAAQFRCSLCNCEFSDLQAKETHLKGRRHRINFKKAVETKGDKCLPIEKTNDRPRVGGKADVVGPPTFAGDGQASYPMDPTLANQLYALSKEIERLNEATISKMLKHIEPLKEITKAINVATEFIITNLNGFKPPVVKKETTEVSANAKESAKANSKQFFVKIIRVDDLAKGIAIRGENRAEIVAVCQEMPTYDMYNAIEQLLASRIEANSNKKEYSVNRVEEPARAVVLHHVGEHAIEVHIRLGFAKKPASTGKDVPEEKVEIQQAMETECTEERQCAEALVAVRRTEWFERIRTSSVQAVLQVIRHLRDKQEPVMANLSDWGWQVLMANVFFEVMSPVSPSILLTVLCEKIASGIVLPNVGLQLLDPCESEKHVNLLDSLTQQHRLSLTIVFQKWLNLIAVGLLGDVLIVDSKEGRSEKEADDEIFDGNGEPKKLKISDDNA